MVEFGGWALPVQYTGILAEHKAVREACGLFDVSHMGEILLTGKDALAFLNQVCTNGFTSLEAGRCRYSPMCYPDGGTVDDLIVYKLPDRVSRESPLWRETFESAPDDGGKYLIIVNASNCEKDYAWMRGHLAAYQGAALENVSAEVAQLAVQGPAFREVLARVGMEGELPDKPYAFVESMKVGGAMCLVSTTGYTGEPGVEIYLRPADAPALFDALIEAGAVPCGLGSRDTLRFEASMPLYGHELEKDITPLEAGLKSFVKMDKPDFIGKGALVERPPQRRRIGLELVDKGVAREHCPVLDAAGRTVGHTTSGGLAPTLGKNLAMAIVSNEAAEHEELFIEVRGRGLRARQIKLPFYKTGAR